jgi:TonB family protein
MVSWKIPLHESPLRKLRGAGVSLIALLFLAPQANTQQEKLDELAGESAAAINLNFKYVKGNPKVRVLDFKAMHQGSEELGSKLAELFSDSLRRQARGFVVLDRMDGVSSLGDGHLSVNHDDQIDAMDCSAEQSGGIPNALVEGLFDILSGDAVSLSVKVLDHDKTVFEKRITLPLSSQLRAVASKPTPLKTISDSPKPIVWVNTDRALSDTERVVRLSEKSDNTFKAPTCLRCPNPSFPDTAVAAKANGTVKFDVEIDSEGFPVRIRLVEGSRCGFTSTAIDAVTHWTFSPALAPDGKPVAVVVPIEVTFRTY